MMMSVDGTRLIRLIVTYKILKPVRVRAWLFLSLLIDDGRHQKSIR